MLCVIRLAGPCHPGAEQQELCELGSVGPEVRKAGGRAGTALVFHSH